MSLVDFEAIIHRTIMNINNSFDRRYLNVHLDTFYPYVKGRAVIHVLSSLKVARSDLAVLPL